MNKHKSFLLIACLTIMLSCSLPGFGGKASQNASSIPPQEANAGMHVFHVVPTSQTCELSTEEHDEARIVTFSEGHVEITNANKDGSNIYEEIGDNMYHRITDTGRPIVLSFSSTGFVMEVFEVEGANDSACAYYTFSIKE